MGRERLRQPSSGPRASHWEKGVAIAGRAGVNPQSVKGALFVGGYADDQERGGAKVVQKSDDYNITHKYHEEATQLGLTEVQVRPKPKKKKKRPWRRSEEGGGEEGSPELARADQRRHFGIKGRSNRGWVKS